MREMTMVADSILIISPNWLGDAVMAMPAVQRFRREHPATRLTLLAKPGVAALWRMHAAPDAILELPPGAAATFAVARRVRARRFTHAYLLPNSFRSALIPFLAGIPKRRGTAFHARGMMVNDRVSLAPLHRAGANHQTSEYFQILCGYAHGDWADTGFSPPPAPLPDWLRLDAGDLPVAMIPGAARGASKRWPYFAEAARHVLARRPDVRFIIAGSAAEAALCKAVAEKIGDRAVSVAGSTDLAAFAALLGGCRAVLCNDSGGMHLASAAGVPVVAIFGVTDPDATGPIGPKAIIIRAEGVKTARAVPRTSEAAAAALASIPPARVAAACLEVLNA